MLESVKRARPSYDRKAPRSIIIVIVIIISGSSSSSSSSSSISFGSRRRSQLRDRKPGSWSCMSSYVCIYLSICVYIYIYIYMYLSIYLSIYLSSIYQYADACREPSSSESRHCEVAEKRLEPDVYTCLFCRIPLRGTRWMLRRCSHVGLRMLEQLRRGVCCQLRRLRDVIRLTRTCMHPGIQVCTHPSIHLSVLACVHASMHASINPYICASMHPCVHASMRPWMRASVHPCVRTSVHPCIHTSVHLSW